MVRKLLFGLIIFSAFIVNAQDFKIDTNGVDVTGTSINIDITDINYSGNYSGSVNFTITNLSAASKTIQILRHVQTQDSLTYCQWCDDGSCFGIDPPTDDYTMYGVNGGTGRAVAAGSSVTFEVDVRYGITQGSSTDVFTLYEVGNESNNVTLTINFNVITTGINNINSNLTISKAYPNPANANVNFNYDLNSNGFVTIHDVTGKQIGNLELVQGVEKATYNTSDLNDGIYFYNVYVDGVKTTTNKFIVRH